MTTATNLLWIFDEDYGMYVAERANKSLFQIVPITTMAGMKPETTFQIESIGPGMSGFTYEALGMCRELSSAKQVCELLENG